MHILWIIYVRYGTLRYVALRRRYYDADAILLHLPEDLCSSETG